MTSQRILKKVQTGIYPGTPKMSILDSKLGPSKNSQNNSIKL